MTSAPHAKRAPANPGEYDSLSAALQAAMFRFGLNQRQTAAELGVAPQAISDWVNERRLPSPAQVPTLAAWLGMTTDEVRSLCHERKTPAELGREVRALRDELAMLRVELDELVERVTRNIRVLDSRQNREHGE
jgi:transcriptional regulator with XRE-family HTH domain